MGGLVKGHGCWKECAAGEKSSRGVKLTDSHRLERKTAEAEKKMYKGSNPWRHS